MKELIEEINDFKPHVEYVFRDPILFGDYRNALEMGEPRIYEDLQDYDAAKALFEQVCHFSAFYFCNSVANFHFVSFKTSKKVLKSSVFVTL